MNEQEKQKYYGNEAFETIYEKAKKDYAPELASFTPLTRRPWQSASARPCDPCTSGPSPPCSGGTGGRTRSWTRTPFPGAWAAAPSSRI